MFITNYVELCIIKIEKWFIYINIKIYDTGRVELCLGKKD